MEMIGTCEKSSATIRDRLAYIEEIELDAMRTIDETILCVTGKPMQEYEKSEEKCMVESIDLIEKRMRYLFEQILMLRGIIA